MFTSIVHTDDVIILADADLFLVSMSCLLQEFFFCCEAQLLSNFRGYDFVKKGPTNSGIVKPPPPFQAMPKENDFFLMMSSLIDAYLFVG